MEPKELTRLAEGVSALIVEDDALLLAQLAKLLRRFFAIVYTSTDAEDAWERYQTIHARNERLLVITDIALGRGSGIELTVKIKTQDPFTKVMAISGSDDRRVFVDAINCGIDRFILKPIRHDFLLSTLGTMLHSINDRIRREATQKELESSRRYALQLLEEQDLFLKNAIHEIHTPLSVIITNIDLLRLQQLQSESLDAIEAASRIIENSYEDMTYLMKRDRIPDTIEAIDLATFIRERIQYFTCIARVNDLQLSLQLGRPSLPTLYFSRLKLGRLVDNTLSNAIKYSFHPGDIRVIVGLRQNRLFFEVRNKGQRIIDKEKIFERFYREERHKGGYGLGLSIVAQICTETGIIVELDSNEHFETYFRYLFQPQHFCDTNAG